MVRPATWYWLAALGIGALGAWSILRRTSGQTLRLRDGRRVTVRDVRPEDKPLFVRALRRAEARTVYHRFGSVKHRFTADELRYLTEVDGHDHYAVGATTREGGVLRGVGGARYVRDQGRPDHAEAAVAVADDYQGQGLGLELFLRVALAARDRGVRVLVCPVLASNRASLAMMRKLDPAAGVVPDGEWVIVTLDLDRLAI